MFLAIAIHIYTPVRRIRPKAPNSKFSPLEKAKRRRFRLRHEWQVGFAARLVGTHQAHTIKHKTHTQHTAHTRTLTSCWVAFSMNLNSRLFIYARKRKQTFKTAIKLALKCHQVSGTTKFPCRVCACVSGWVHAIKRCLSSGSCCLLPVTFPLAFAI